MCTRIVDPEHQMYKNSIRQNRNAAASEIQFISDRFRSSSSDLDAPRRRSGRSTDGLVVISIT